MSSGQKFASTSRHDPYRNFNFKVTFSGKRTLVNSGWMFVSGLKAITDYMEQNEGGNIGANYQIPDSIRFEPVQLMRGMSEDMDIVTILGDQHDSIVGVNNRNKYTVTITLLDKDKSEARKFILYEAWISAWETSDFNALGSEVFLDKVTLSYTDLEIVELGSPKINSSTTQVLRDIINQFRNTNPFKRS